MSTQFYIKQGDTGPPVIATLLDADGNAVSMLGISGVRFHMRNAGGVVVDAVASVEDADAGKVRYDWTMGDTDVAGTFSAEFEVDFGGNLIETFPNDRNLHVIVTKELA